MTTAANLRQAKTIEDQVHATVNQWWNDQNCKKDHRPFPRLRELRANAESFGQIEAAFSFDIPKEFGSDANGKYTFSDWTDLEDLYIRLQTCPGLKTTHWRAFQPGHTNQFTVEYAATVAGHHTPG